MHGESALTILHVECLKTNEASGIPDAETGGVSILYIKWASHRVHADYVLPASKLKMQDSRWIDGLIYVI